MYWYSSSSSGDISLVVPVVVVVVVFVFACLPRASLSSPGCTRDRVQRESDFTDEGRERERVCVCARDELRGWRRMQLMARARCTQEQRHTEREEERERTVGSARELLMIRKSEGGSQ